MEREWLERDYYKDLGVSPSASSKEISDAYRKLAKKYHPDNNQGDETARDNFTKVATAYEVLHKPDKRKEYDEAREMMRTGAGAGRMFGGGPSAGSSSDGFSFDMNDLLGNLGGMFGGGAGAGNGRRYRPTSGGPRRGQDLDADLYLDFLDAVHGVTTTVAVHGDAPCTTCGGNGARPGTAPEPCPNCGGTGSIALDQGLFSVSQPCSACSATGVYIDDPCPSCRGGGVEQRTRNVTIRVPAGVKDGQRIRVKARGGAGANGGPRGDLYVTVHVKAHERFGRSGDNLTVTMPITYWEAALGTKVSVPTLDDDVTIKIPAGTSSGKKFRVKNRGVKKKSGYGDLIVRVEVAVPAPSQMSEEETSLLEQLRDTSTFRPRAQAEESV